MDEANAFIGVEHRHVGKVVGAKFALGAFDAVGEMVGVVVVARTTARGLHHPQRAEVTRLATNGTTNSCSFLYQRARRAAQAMGYLSCKTYTRTDESGASLRAVGACCEAEIAARSWAAASKKRPRKDKSAPAARRRWELLPATADLIAPTRPALRYHGGKWRLAPWIIEQFPAHRVYVEPFSGAASVMLRKKRSDFEVYNDLDGDVVNVFRVLRHRVRARELERTLRLTPWSRAEFELSYEPSDDVVERARRTIVRCFMGHGTTSRRRNRTGFRAGSHPNRAGGGFGDWRGYHDVVKAFTHRLQGVVIEQRDAMEILERYDAPDALFYVDPPYVTSTRVSVRGPGDGDRCYAHDMTDDDHRRLAARLGQVQGAVIVSGYPCRLYDEELYANWERKEKRARSDRASERTEATWMKPAGVTYAMPAAMVMQPSLDLAVNA